MAFPDWEAIAFLVTAAFALGGAVGMLRARNIVHSVLWLSLTFFSVAVLFILMEAEYLAIIQIMIYIGAIAIVILFGIMLTRQKIMEEEP